MIYGIRDAANITLKEAGTNNVVLYSDYARSVENSWTSDQDYAYAKSTRAIRWDFDKQGELTMSFEVFDLSLIAIALGGKFEDKEGQIAKREVLQVDDTLQVELAKLDGELVDGSLSVKTLKEDLLTHDKDLVKGSVAEAGEYTYDAGVFTFNAADVSEGDYVVVYYIDSLEALNQLQIKAEDFPIAYHVSLEALKRARHGSQADSVIHVDYPIARPIGEIDISFSADNITTIDVTFELFPDESGNLATYYNI